MDLTRNPANSPSYVGSTLSKDNACSNLGPRTNLLKISARLVLVKKISTLTQYFAIISLTK